MIRNGEKEEWHLHYQGESKHDSDFYCLNCLHSFKTENKIKSYEKVRKNKYFCGTKMPSEKHNTL